MQILIYIEPYPLRNEADHYRDIAIEFANMLVRGATEDNLQEFDIRIYGNRETLTRIQEATIAAKRFLLWPERNEIELFREGLDDWTTGGIEGWEDLLRGEGRITTSYREVLEAVHQRFPFEIVVHWGDNGAVRSFSEQSGIRHVAMSQAAGRLPFLDPVMFDALGTGGRSTPAQASIEAFKTTVDKESWPAEVDLKAFSSPQGLDVAHTLYGAVNFSGSEHLLTRGSARAVLMPLQPHDDAGFLIDSSFGSPAEMINSTLPTLADNGVVTVVWPEPACVNRPGGDLALQTAKTAVAKYGDKALWLDPASESVTPLQLLNLTDAVVTANSFLGFEAMLLDKPTCVLGNAAYAPEGCSVSLQDFAERHFDKQAYLRNIRAIRSFFLRAYLEDRTTAFALPSFVNRVCETADVGLYGRGEPELMVQQAFDRFAETNREAALRRLKPVPLPQTERRIRSEPVTVERRSSNTGLSGLFQRAASHLQKSLGRNADVNASPQPGSQREDQVQPGYALTENEKAIIDKAIKSLDRVPQTKNKTAVIAHCFYLDATHKLLNRLSKLEPVFDLHVTAPSFGTKEIRQAVTTTFPEATVISVPNRGEDIWPFCFMIAQLAPRAYELVLKVHTKKNFKDGNGLDEELGTAWLNYALDCLIGPVEESDRHNGIPNDTKNWSIAGPEELLQLANRTDLRAKFSSEPILDELSASLPDNWLYFEGAMYWAKPDMIEKATRLFSDPAKFPPGKDLEQNGPKRLADLTITLQASQEGNLLATLGPGKRTVNLTPHPKDHDISEVLKRYAR